MISSEPISEFIMNWYHEFDAYDPNLHLFCPKISDDDYTNYDEPNAPDADGVTVEEKQRRFTEAHKRHVTATQLSILLAIPREESSTWLDVWKQKVESFLTKCDACARYWHKSRDAFLKTLELEMPSDNVDYLEQALNDFDKQRIDTGLKKARAILEESGPMSSAKLAERDISAVLSLFEALCCMPYLSQPANRTDFDYVFENTQKKKPLRMQGGIIPTMTFFLFDDNIYRKRFAESAWQRREPESLTEEEWEWAVQPHLTEVILKNSHSRGSPTPEKISQFWHGFLLILRSLSEQRIVDSLRAMEVTPSVYMLALEHLGTSSDVALAQVLKGLQSLMERSRDAFWAAYDQVTPSQLIEEIVKSPAFRPLLDRSLVPDMMVMDGIGKMPILATWMKALIRSLPLIRRSDACESLLRHLFDTFGANPNLTQEARATCILAGLVALGESLDGYLQLLPTFDTGTALIMVNQLLNRVVQYKQVIIDAAELKAGDIYNVGRSRVALAITQSALALDAKATWAEWDALIKGIPVQDAVNRDSGALWEAFLELLWIGQVDLAKAMLLATMPLRNIEKFMPMRKEKLQKEQEKFNNRYQQQTAAIGKMLGRLSDFNPADLHMFCSGPQSQTIHPIVASLIHGEDTIREAGFELVKAITSETQPSEAVNQMLEKYFSQTLGAFSSAVESITSEKDTNIPWSHMLPTLKCSEYILNGLSDSSVGQLRLRILLPGERAIVERWWKSAWRLIGRSFQMMREWHKKVDKKTMEDFCRDVMELAEKFLAQDGLVASALDSNRSPQPNDDTTSEAMKTVLDPPALSSFSLVDMLQLRDRYLVQGIIGVIKKLLGRLKDNDMALPRKTVAFLESMLKKRRTKDGAFDYAQKTILTDEQRIELLKALGEDAAIEEQFIGTKPGEKEAKEKERAKKQIKIDFSKASIKDYTNDITPNFDKSFERRAKAALESQKLKAPIKPDPKAILATQASIKEARAKEKAERQKRNAEVIAKAQALRAPTRFVPGEGSGLQGIAGVQGKDHAPTVKDEIMVGSSSEEDEESDDELITQHARTGQRTMDDAERRRQRLLAEKTRGPVKKQKKERSAKDMRARLIPPMDVLHQAILEWDIFHEGNDPPNGYRCEGVSDTYVHPGSYKQTFFPLLINEAWRSFVTSKDEATSKPFGIKIINRMTVDKFMEVTASVPAMISKDRGLSEGDIVIISKGEDPLNQPGEVHCLSRIWKTTNKKDRVEVVFRLNAKGNQLLSVLLPGSEFNVVKITNMITIEREYAALESLQYYDLMDEVLKAEPSPMLKFGDEAVEGVASNYQLNAGQARAVLNAKANDGFTLIQGPPGTGKTKTIVAMVGSLLTGALKTSTGAVAINRPGAQVSNGQGMSKKLLVCAPSNAAVDELVLRLKAGVKTMNGTFHKIDVVRLGRSDAISEGVRDVTLEELVKAKMGESTSKDTISEREKTFQEAGEISKKMSELRPQLESARESGDRAFTMKLTREFDALKQRQIHIGAKIDAYKSGGNNTFMREADIKRRQIQQEILDKAHVLCATLSGSGHELFKGLNVEFETVIIDEAAQCVELSALIPLKYGCQKCILVGDPKQLPPTVLSQSAARYGYDQSLFVRMQKNHAQEVHLLDQQYRMHPEISLFPSREFYEGLLQDGADMAKLRLQPWHESSLLGPYRFFDVTGSQSRGPKNQSLVNEEEIKVAMQLYNRFRTDYSGVELKAKIGIITPYKAQLFRLRQRFAERYGEEIKDRIEFNTTDAFQGRECEIIIFSCVRASPTGGIGFMTDIRRMNVGLTRAKSSLWILGDSRALVQGEFWAKLIEDSKRRDRYTSGNILNMLSRPGPKLSPAAFASLAVGNGGWAGTNSRVGDVKEVEDVEMTDAPATTPQLPLVAQPTPVAVVQRAPPPNPPTSEQSAFPNRALTTRGAESPRLAVPEVAPRRGQSGGELNERGESKAPLPRGVGPPTIQSTVGGVPKKRALEGGDEKHNAAKKIHRSPDAALSRAPTGPRSYQPPKATDPSAMEVLGLAPPERPPPAQQHRPPPGPSTIKAPGGSRAGAPQGGPKGPVMPPRKKPPADPFIKRKPGKR
ncbi:SEN1 N terminal-domain-containing protein [Cercophora scortea]|uniref:SEN1 N terminal-domain-containing protein n=1 Tax=Cercophora scortea TaxID=314031 RepID=A0AAE0ML41_9PEZI|nr:SEN1 N terminal-domain-containing protein [Cercophora scortea]